MTSNNPGGRFRSGSSRAGTKNEKRKPTLPDQQTGAAQDWVQPLRVGFDKPLLYATLALSLLGLFVLFSASSPVAARDNHNSAYFLLRQCLSFIMGYAALIYLTLSQFNFRKLNGLSTFSGLLLMGALMITMVIGVTSYGAERWIKIPLIGMQVQPSEFAKIVIPIILASALSQQKRLFSFSFWSKVLIVLGSIYLIFEQPNLSMTIILLALSALMCIIAGTPSWLIGGGLFLGSIAGVYKLRNTEYQWRRIVGWLDPWADAQDTGYNIIQAFKAISEGGFWGKGYGLSLQKLYYLPFQYTDFIFPIYIEEMGFVGAVMMVGLYGFILYRGMSIATTCRNSFGQLLAMALTLCLGMQVLINMSVSTGLFPVTGVTLPLVSYGGTSVLVTLLLIGILLNISRFRDVVKPIR
jgi:cell division protein FtsW